MTDRHYADPDTGELVTDTRQNVRHLPPPRPEPMPHEVSSLPMQSATIAEITKALIVAQAAFKPIGRSAKAMATSTRSYNYAPLEDIIAATRDGMAKAGLAISQTTHPTPRGAMLVTMLQHVSGEWKASYWPLLTTGRPQEEGSAQTYARRYQRCAILDIQPEDADDDGAAASQQDEKKQVRAQRPAPAPARKPVDPEAAAFVDGMAKDAEDRLGPAPYAAGSEPVPTYIGMPSEVTSKETAKGGKSYRVIFSDPSTMKDEWFGTFEKDVADLCQAAIGKARVKIIYETSKYGKKILEVFPND